jgi:hypothetical protein
MPIIPSPVLNCVFYLYKDKATAQAGIDAGGTGFFLAMPTADGLGHHYGVTNWHVAVKNGFSCIRINAANGPEVIELDPADWVFEPGSDDIAIAPLSIRRPEQVAMFVGTQIMLNRDNVASERIGPGDDVFMVGCFVDLNMRLTNVPAVRFGNISTYPVPITQPTGYDKGVGYCVDMHSRTGYSGSPVFVYRTPGNSLEWLLTDGPVVIGRGFFLLLGIHWGQFPEALPIRRTKRATPRESSNTKDLYEEYVEGMSGMTCVVPAWRIADVLNHDTLKNQRQKEIVSRAESDTAGGT